MLGPQDTLGGGERPLVERLGFPIAPLRPIQARQVVEAAQGLGMNRPVLDAKLARGWKSPPP